MSIYVGREGEISMTSPSLTAQADPDAPPTISLTEGEETTVHCNVKAAFPTPIFTWEGVAAAGGGGDEGWFDEGQIRVRKYAKTYADNGRGLSGNITVVQQVRLFLQWKYSQINFLIYVKDPNQNFFSLKRPS